ncbi:MAG: alanine/glycine:cation symporter family protein [Ruminococcus sp.]
MNDFILKLNGYLWGFPMIALLFFTHIFMTVKTGGIQRKVFKGIRLSLTRAPGDTGEISPFQSLATTLASTLGTGNIVGIGTAVAMGGAGAVFWCWITGIAGMATQYAEVLLAVKYRVKNEAGEYLGGTMYVLKRGLNSKALSLVYAFSAAAAGMLTGGAIQSNAIGAVVSDALGGKDVCFKVFSAEISLSALLVGTLASALTAIVVFGGISAVGKVCEYLVPFMACVFMLGCFAVLFINRAVLLDSFKVILTSAFSLKAVTGGVGGSAMMLACRFGMARGLFSNEAGLGTSSVISACAKAPNPVRQGLVSMTATFWDTVVMCLVTGLVVVSSVLSKGSTDFFGLSGTNLCYNAFSELYYVGKWIYVFGMITFAFSTVLGWSLIGVRCVQYVFGAKSKKPYLVIWVASVFIAPLLSLDTVWNLADTFNAVLVIPNVSALLLLSKEVKSETRLFINDINRLAV